MDAIIDSLVSKAKERFPVIYPCGGRKSWSECVTVEGTLTMLWFDTPDHSTHIEVTHEG